MKARRIKRRELARARSERQSTVILLLTVVGGAVVMAGLVWKLGPMCGSAQAVAAQVLRGEKINLTVTTDTNLASLTNASFAATNPPVAATNLIGLPLAPLVTNVTAAGVIIEGGKYRAVSFGQLAGFRFKATEDILAMDADPEITVSKVLKQIPPDVEKLNDQAVALTGYMLPLKLHEGLVTHFILLPNTQGCCYGRMPRFNEIVFVSSTRKGFKPMKDILITIAGTFHVGAVRNNNRLIGIYQMDCERAVEATSLAVK